MTTNQVYQNGGPAVTADALNTFAQVCPTVQSARNFVGTTGMSILVQGALAAGDGGGGIFYWDALGAAADDGGITTIVPPSAGSGEWTRDDVSVANAVTLNGVQTLTNKTLTAPVINNPDVTGGTFTGITINGVNFLTNTPNEITTTYTLVAPDGGKTIYAGGSAYYTINVPASNALAGNFQCIIKNADSTRGKLINISGLTPFILWPLQSFILQNDNQTAWNLIGSPSRWITPSAVTLYVDPNVGSNSNDGLAAGPGGALSDIQTAYFMLRSQFDFAGSTPTIQLADGTYNVGAGIVITYGLVGSVQLQIVGDVNSPQNVIISCSAGSNCFMLRESGAVATIFGVSFQTIGNGSTAASVSQFATLDLGNPANNTQGNVYGNFPLGNHHILTTSASLNFLANYEVTSNCATHITAEFNSYTNYGSITVNIPNPLTFTNWVVATDLGVINAGGVPVTFTGSGAGSGSTGKKYASQSNADINSSSTSYPGATAGSTATGGLYS